ncbi:MAG: 2-amino-4-hydroxy-6-hydroxymethyldihydropteridine diphosphokinase [Thermodesulfobacteriota bacterium]
MRAYLGLGSNLGDPEANLAEARQRLAEAPGITVVAASPVYRTEPQGLRSQPWFANQVLQVLYNGPGALDLLQALAGIESAMGRARPKAGEAGEGERFGPRVIDLDLLLFGSEVLASGPLTLPHPRMRERAFVLVPLADLTPDLAFPDGETLAACLGRLEYRIEKERIYQAGPDAV